MNNLNTNKRALRQAALTIKQANGCDVLLFKGLYTF
jgi:hypothetical protein